MRDADQNPRAARHAADFILTGAGRLVTLAPNLPYAVGSLGVIARGALAARRGRIVWIGPESGLGAHVDVDGVAHERRCDAGGHVVLPGFVDSHTHFVFAGDRAEEFQLRHAGASYEEIAARGGGILSTVRHTRAASAHTLEAIARARLRRFAAHGTTTVEGKTGYGLDVASEARCLAVMRALVDAPGLPSVVPTFLGAHTIPPEYREPAGARAAYIALVTETMLPRFAGQARFCDVFCERGAFTVTEARHILTRASDLGYQLKVHANQLSDSGGARLAAEVHAISADHLDFARDDELDLLRDAGVVGTLLPGCAFTLGTPYPSARRLLDRGLHVALATDFNPGTCYCESMQMMIALAISAMDMTLEEALVAATLGGARALGMADEIGSLEPGKRCDLSVLTESDERALGYHFGVNLVAWTVVRGQPPLALAPGA